MRYMLLSLVLSSTLILYEHGDRSGQQLVRTISDPTLVDDGWNDRVSAIRVTGGCQWILYQDSNYDGTSSVIGPGDQNYHHTIFGIPNDELSSVRCLPSSNFHAIALFQHASMVATCVYCVLLVKTLLASTTLCHPLLLTWVCGSCTLVPTTQGQVFPEDQATTQIHLL